MTSRQVAADAWDASDRVWRSAHVMFGAADDGQAEHFMDGFALPYSRRANS